MSDARRRIAEYLCDWDRSANGPGLTWEDFTDQADEILTLADIGYKEPEPETEPAQNLLTGNDIAARLHEIVRNRRSDS